MPLTSPYNFVPLYHTAFLPDWGNQVCQDAPFQDGICGTFKLKITNKTPLFIRGTTSESEFFKTPDNRYAIPGTSLRGMLRNVVEIASFGKMTRVNNHTYGVRDLHNQNLYGQHMARIMLARNGRSLPLPLVGAGWLRQVGDVWQIIPCDFAKVHYKQLIAHAQALKVQDYNPGKKQSSVRKYQNWKTAPLDAFAQVEPLRDGSDKGWMGSFGQVNALATTPKGLISQQGRLVFTGQPSVWDPHRAPRSGGGHPKQHDFFFFNRKNLAIRVESTIQKAFEFVHRDSGQQNRLEGSPNEEWGYWKQRLERGEDVPVFYLLNQNRELRAFGLAMMFRLAYDRSTLQAVRNTQPEVWKNNQYDLAELIFGHVPLEAHTANADQHGGIRGRVSIGLALAEGQPKLDKQQNLILGAPKASYYPAYIEQGAEPGENPTQGDRAPNWHTYMNEDVKVRGWKRYRPQSSWGAFSGFEREGSDVKKMQVKSDKVGTSFTPVAPGSMFSGPVRVHNLRRVELGALLWAIDFGNFKEGVHLLGMGKPYGFGSVVLSIEASQLKDMEGNPVDLKACQAEFEQLMERWAVQQQIPGGWKGSRVIHELLLCSVPVSDRNSVRYPSLDHPVNRNEFQRAKADGCALLAAGRIKWQGPNGWFRRGTEVSPKPPPPAAGGRAYQATITTAPTARSTATTSTIPASPSSTHAATYNPTIELEQSSIKGKQFELVRAWIKESGPKEATRKQAAIGFFSATKERMRMKYADIVIWMEK